MAVKARGSITLVRVDDGENGKGIKTTTITYQAGTSGTTAPTGTWSSSIPTVTKGQYLWSKTVITYTDNTTSTTYSVAYIPTNGATGATGTGVASITQQYYLSTSKTTQTGGSWVTSMPVWSSGKYLWTRYAITYKNPTSTAYTSPICDSSWEAVNEIEVGGRNYLLNGDFSKTKTSSSTTDKHQNLYAKKWSGYNNGISNPTTSYHAHVDDNTFAFNVVEFNESDGSRNWKGMSQIMNNMEEYVNTDGFRISVDIYATGTGTKLFGGFYHYLKDGTTQAYHSGQFSIKPTKTNKWYRLSAKVPLLSNVDLNKPISFYIYGYGFTTNSILYIKNVSLNVCTNTTDWTPAPEDQENIITSDTAPTDTTKMWFDTTNNLLKHWDGEAWIVVNDYADDMNNMKQQITTEYTSSINQLKESLTSLVEKLQTTTTENTTSINSLSSQIAQNATSITMATTSIQEITDKLTGLTTKEEISKWARYEDGILELGSSDSPFAVKLSQTELGFYQNGTRIAYLSNQQLNISQAVVMQQINIGTFQIIFDEEYGLMFM